MSEEYYISKIKYLRVSTRGAVIENTKTKIITKNY